jgi:CRP-like cAMP-binding protein
MLNTTVGTSTNAGVGPWVTAPRQQRAARQDHLDDLASVATRVKVRNGAEIFAEGDEADYCYRIVSGQAMAFKLMSDGHRQVFEFLLPGDFFGYEAQADHYFTVEAVSDVVVLKYPRRAIERVLAENPTFAREIQQMTARGLHSAYQRMLLLTHKSADERVAWFLLELADRSKNADALHLPMTRTDIADYLGMVIETVSRALTRLKRCGAIAMQSVNDIHLVDRHRLELVRGEI